MLVCSYFVCDVTCEFHLKVMEDDQEIAAFMFRRTVPSTHLTPDDIRWMVITILLTDSYSCIT